MFKIVGRHVPPPAGVPSPLQWGTAARLESLLGAHADLRITRRSFTFRFRSPQDYVETFSRYYGPIVKALAALDDAGRTSLRNQLLRLAADHNRNTDGAATIEAEYLEVLASRRGR
jgi:hypothetical protein